MTVMTRPFPTGSVVTVLSQTQGPVLQISLLEPGDMLPSDLQRQTHHIAFEFMRLRGVPFSADGLRSGDSNTTQEAVTRRLNVHFEKFLGHGVDEEEMLGEARLAEETLREVRELYDKDHFFTQAMQEFHWSFTQLSTDNSQFASTLFRTLYDYRRKRDEALSRFMERFDPYAQQIRTIIESVPRDSFRHFEIELRIKGNRDVFPKIRKRAEEEGWTDMSQFFDLIGLRIIVGNQAEVDAAVVLVEGALKLHEVNERNRKECPHYFRVDNIEEKISVARIDPQIHHDITTGYNRISHNDRGYRGKHINMMRTCNGKKRDYATGEAQGTSDGINQWGKRQRLLVYKEKDIPKALKDLLKDHCRLAADFIVACESRPMHNEHYPEFDTDIVDLHIPAGPLRGDVYYRLADMEELMKDYQYASLDLPELEPHSPSLPPEEVTPIS